MKSKINNLRTCIITNGKFDKSKLIRVVRYQGEFKIDKNHNLPGRGAYFQKNKNIVDEIRKKRLLHRAFKENVPNEVYEELIKYIREEENGR
ncbi:YlxR family protein [Mycoplasma marinum]|uniref:DUF448 domain-containing protein n=1 Tax=Mycoplasma marinum TaxID=1937190 RepID=A0A4R0XQN9_9MOLU|nr:YlxR family protein [Mycoplasma marinum]TCG11908.1 DUF448 domain-containing protein [Mycoplasma marinum]